MKKCFLCGEESKIIDFSEPNFRNCFLKIQFRKKRGFKYGDIHLTKNTLDDLGYHRICYQKVTVLEKKYNEQYLSFVKNFEVSKNFRNINIKEVKL